MNSDIKDIGSASHSQEDGGVPDKAKTLLDFNIGQSIDILVEYLMDNNVDNIHQLIMGEVERRLLIKVLDKSRGNKRQAARQLGISRNTFHRKLSKFS